jgi:hypothetical protein
MPGKHAHHCKGMEKQDVFFHFSFGLYMIGEVMLPCNRRGLLLAARYCKKNQGAELPSAKASPGFHQFPKTLLTMHLRPE